MELNHTCQLTVVESVTQLCEGEYNNYYFPLISRNVHGLSPLLELYLIIIAISFAGPKLWKAFPLDFYYIFLAFDTCFCPYNFIVCVVNSQLNVSVKLS